MTPVLPHGYLTLLEAAEFLLPFSGQTSTRATIISDIWDAVDAGKVRAFAIGGYPRRIVRLDADLTKAIPLLRSSRGRDFNFLRPTNPVYRPLTSRLGIDLSVVTLAFQELEIRKFGQVQKRRAKHDGSKGKMRRGRPSLRSKVQVVIRDVVKSEKWRPLDGIKALTQRINQSKCLAKIVSEDTVARALDELYANTQDRRFQRPRRKPRRK